MAALVSLSDYKSYAGITGTGDDTALTAMLGMASAAVRRHCGRNMSTGFAAATYTEHYDGTGAEWLQLREWPLASVTSIESLDDAGTYTTIPATDYRVELTTGLVYRLGAAHGRFAYSNGGILNGSGWRVQPCWEDGFNNYRVVYVVSAAVADDITLAVCRMVDLAFAQRRTNPGMQSESIGAYSYSRMDAALLDKQVAGWLAPFRTGVL